jgi:hypothetical protein
MVKIRDSQLILSGGPSTGISKPTKLMDLFRRIVFTIPKNYRLAD